MDNKSTLNCIVYPQEKATVNVIYGLYSEFESGKPHHNLMLCDKAAKELWEKVSNLVNLGWAHWTNKQIK